MPYVESMLMCGIWHTIADGVIELDRSWEIWFWLSLTGGIASRVSSRVLGTEYER